MEQSQRTSFDGLVDHLFRRSAGQMVSALARVLGSERLDLAEEAVQDALVRALQKWPYRGLPDNPRGWLFQVARNRALDLLRREGVLRGKLDSLAAALVCAPPAAAPEGGGVGDDELAMMFMCCHPCLPRPARVALTLKTVSGLGVEQIAAALLAQPATIAQRLVRAKRQIREERIALEIPPAGELRARLDSVLEVLYLLFTEGYGAHGGENLLRGELCGEAIRLGEILAHGPHADEPRVHALMALMLLQASRLSARADEAGDLLLLSEQDRSRWDRGLIAEGLRHLGRAASGGEITPFHLEAAIAACHAVADDEASTDWKYVLHLYDDLRALKPSPVVELNRAVALAMVEGPAAGIRALERIHTHPALERYHLLPATLAGLWLKAGAPEIAARYYRNALELPCSAPERRFMRRQLEKCEARPGEDQGQRPDGPETAAQGT